MPLEEKIVKTHKGGFAKEGTIDEAKARQLIYYNELVDQLRRDDTPLEVKKTSKFHSK